MARSARVLMLIVAAATVAAALGCGGPPRATIKYLAGGVDESVGYDLAVYQMARNEKVQIVLYRRVAAPIGVADTDFEYVFFELPEVGRYGWLKEDNVPAYRWVHHEGHNYIWQGASGQVTIGESTDHSEIRFGFQVTMEPIAGTPGGSYLLSGKINCKEDVITTQGLITRYSDWLRTLTGEKPKTPPASAKPPKSAATPPAKAPANVAPTAQP
jgi:hypothetical protein